MARLDPSLCGVRVGGDRGLGGIKDAQRVEGEPDQSTWLVLHKHYWENGFRQYMDNGER